MRVRRPIVAAVALGALAGVPAAPAHAQAPTWIAAWGAAPNAGTTKGPGNATVRNVARVTIGGSQLRLRLSNPDPGTPLQVGAASVALQKPDGGAALAAPPLPVTFDGRAAVTVAPKTTAVYSDPVDLPVAAGQNVAVSLFLAAAQEPAAYTATWNSLFATDDGAGDKTAEQDGASFSAPPATPTGGSVPDTCESCNTYALTAIDVLTTEADGAYVGLGSSTFHGYNSTPNAFDSVLYDLAARENAEIPSGRREGIVNAGIGGDTLHAGLNRLDRDVFSQTGVTGVIVYDVNDLASRTAEEIEGDYRLLIARAHARAVLVFCPTWPPAAQSAPSTIRGNERRKLNAWILNSAECDDVVDWDAVLRGAAVQDEYDPAYYTDGIHPNAAGHRAMADATPLRWFRYGAPATAPGGAPAFGSDLGLPATRRCVSRRSFVIRVRAPRGVRLRSARVYVNARRVRSVRFGRRLTARVDLRGLPRGTVRVRIVARTRSGRSYVRTRSYRTCTRRGG